MAQAVLAVPSNAQTRQATARPARARRGGVLLGLVAAVALAIAAPPALAQDRFDHDHDRHFDHGHPYAHRYSFEAWRGGRWIHGVHDGRMGWWWFVGGVWYFYPAPVYPYPEPPAEVYVAPAAPAPAVTYYYWCPRPRGYYPYVPACRLPWRAVPAAVQAPPPQPAPPPGYAPAPAPAAPPPGAYAPPNGAPTPPPNMAPPPG